MEITIAKLAQKLNLEYEGDDSWLVTQASGLDGTDEHAVAFVGGASFEKQAKFSAVKTIVCPYETNLPEKNRIFSPYPEMTIVEITKILHPAKPPSEIIHSSFIVGRDCNFGKKLTIEANVIIGDRVCIGSGTVIMSGAVIGNDCLIGKNCLIHPNVTIRDNTQIGDKVIVNSGAVIGSDGFGFVTHKERHYKIPQIGKVIIESDVEIGANNTIDRGRFGVTRIGRGCKLDNLVHVGHNVELGEDSLVVGMVGFAGSTKTGHHLIMGGQSMISGHLKIGNNVTVSAKSLLAKNVGDGNRYAGIPARPHKEWLKANSYLYRIHEIFEFIKNWKKEK